MSDTIIMIKYFWEEKGDIERWVGWETAQDVPPEIRKVWNDYKIARKILETMIEALREENE